MSEGSFRASLTRRLLVVRPNGLHFGHLGLELLMAYAEARATGAAVCLVAPVHLANPALLHLMPDGIRVFRWSPWTAALVAPRLWTVGLGGRLRLAWHRGMDRLKDDAADTLREHIGSTPMPASLRARLRSLRSTLARRTGPSRGYIRVRDTYYRRRVIRAPVPVRMPAAAHAEAEAAIARLGVPPGQPMVAIHAREPGFKQGGLEVQAKAASRQGAGLRDDSLRNSRIEDYRTAVERLQAGGYAVVRLGDPSMAPLAWPGVVDLATPPDASALQVYCLRRSRFLIAGESGPSAVAMLTNTPILTVNATDAIGSYPVRREGLMLLKRVADRRDGRILTPIDMLSEDYYTHLRDPSRFDYQDNTAAEIDRAVVEMLDRLGGAADSPVQVQFREAATEAAERLRDRFAYVRKWGTDDGFLGDGGVALFAGPV